MHTQPTRSTNTKRRLSMMLILLLPACVLLALSLGTINISLPNVLTSLFSTADGTTNQLVIMQIRLPRALLALLVGALLGMCGATTQGLFRNPLADPSLIGVTSGASAGAAVTIFGASSIVGLTGFSGLGLVAFGAFVGGAIAVIGVYKLATNQHGTSVATMLLAGIAITAVAGGLTSFIEFFADNEVLRRISLWRMGGLDGANTPRVTLAVFVSAIVFVLLPRYSTALNALLLGESEARHLGIAVQKTKLHLILLVALGVGSSVALAGTIAFIGLVVPHILRLIIGPNHHHLLPLSALGGAILLVLSDTIARTALAPIELPVGLVTALFGAPFFISLLRNRTQYGLS